MERNDQWVAPTPSRTDRQGLERAADGVGNRVIPDLARRAGPGLVAKPVHPVLRKAAAPFANRIALRANLDTDRLVLAPRRPRQHNTRPPRHGLTRLMSAGQGVQFGTLGRTQHNYSRRPTHLPLLNSHINRSNFKIRTLERDDV